LPSKEIGRWMNGFKPKYEVSDKKALVTKLKALAKKKQKWFG
jgi:hypothetical protein